MDLERSSGIPDCKKILFEIKIFFVAFKKHEMSKIDGKLVSFDSTAHMSHMFLKRVVFSSALIVAKTTQKLASIYIDFVLHYYFTVLETIHLAKISYQSSNCS